MRVGKGDVAVDERNRVEVGAARGASYVPSLQQLSNMVDKLGWER